MTENTKLKCPTLLEAIECVVQLSKDSKMSEELFFNAAPEISIISESYGITEQQAVLFCICMERGPRRIDFDDIARHLDLSNIRVLSFAADIDALVHRRLLRYRDAHDEDSFDVFQPVIKALKHNEVYQLPVRKGLDCLELFEYLNMLYDDLDNDAVSVANMLEEMEQVFDDNPQIGFVKQLKELDLYDDDDQLLLVLFCHLLINKDDDDIHFNQMECIYSEKSSYTTNVPSGNTARSTYPRLRYLKYMEVWDGEASQQPRSSTATTRAMSRSNS